MNTPDVQTSEPAGLIDGVTPVLFEVGFTRTRAEALVRELNRLIAASHADGKGAFCARIPQTVVLLNTLCAQLALPDQGDAVKLGGTDTSDEEAV